MKRLFCFTCDKATIKATFKNKKTGKTYKSKISFTVNVEAKLADVKVAETAKTLAIGGTHQIVATPDGCTFTSAEPKIATVDEKGLVTAVAAGKTTITVAKGEKSALVEITVKTAILKSATQKSLKTVEAIFEGSTDKIDKNTVTIKNNKTGVIVPCSSVAVDAKDKTKCVITSFADLKTETYTVMYEDQTAEFTATDAKVASIAIDPLTVEAGILTDIKAVGKDANDVVLFETKYPGDSNTTITIETTGTGYTQGTGLFLQNVGDKAKASAKWVSGQYDATGAPTDSKEIKDVVITAVAQNAAAKFDYSIGGTAYKADGEKKIKGTDTPQRIYFKFTDDAGNEIKDYSGYSIESSDKNILVVGALTISGNDKYADIIGYKKGTASILVKKGNEFVQAIAIEVADKAKVASIVLDNASVTLSNEAAGANYKMTYTVKDQYTNTMYGIMASVAGMTDSTPEIATAGTGYVKFDATDVAAGTYQYKISCTNPDGSSAQAVATINVVAPNANATAGYSLAVTEKTDGIDYNTSVVDTTVSDNADGLHTLTIALKKSLGGVIADAANVKGTPEVTIKNGSKVVFCDKTGSVVTCAAINGGATTSGLTASSFDIVVSAKPGDIVKYLPAGTYTVQVKGDVYLTGTSGDFKEMLLTTTFTVKDSQPALNWKLTKNTIKSTETLDAATIMGLFDESTSCGDKTIKNHKVACVGVELAPVVGNSVKVKTATFKVTYDKGDINVKVDINQTITKA